MVADSLGNALGAVDDFDDALIAVRDALARLGVARCEVHLEANTAVDDCALPLPVVGSRGLVATIVCSASNGFSTQQIRELMGIATRLSVWCTERGVGTEGMTDVRLSGRQLATARLAARGHTNAEIAEQLGISINTVKLRLKQVFERLDVSNRTELSLALRTWSADPARKS
ncbi:MAG: helix-turn-helix transcriptional regulator [Deltaproteobacteria bacterium]|nr:helix-turn-helix transcriptional regulator [Deltaproteobacteria bacterium]